MSDCGECFHGCTQIVSDQCVKYTGDDIASLDIATGDPLSTVEEKLVEYLLTVMDGTGIFPVITPAEVCALLDTYLDDDGAGADLPEILTAFAQAICDLQAQVTAVVADMTTLNGDYNVSTCLSGVVASSDTHAVTPERHVLTL